MLSVGSIFSWWVHQASFWFDMSYSLMQVVEIAYRYDTDCVPEAYKHDKIAYIKDSSVSKNCTRKIRVISFSFPTISTYLF